jgi:AbrB family looped-hinge helix DNA binding protein
MNFLPKPKLLAVGQLNEKSQLVIPKEAREAIGIGPGDRVIIALAPFGKAIVIAKPEELERHLNDLVVSTQESSADIKRALDEINNKENDK